MVTTLPRSATWQTVVDWLNDGDFTGAYDDVSAARLREPGLTIALGMDSARSLSPPKIGTATCDLRNTDQAYSAEFPGSPIYQQMLPGRPVEHRATAGAEVAYDSDDSYDSDLYYNGEAQRTVHTGVLDDMPQHPERTSRRVGLSTLGSLTKLRGRRTGGRRISTALYESITTGAAIGHILDAIGWPSADRDIDTGDTTLLYWWLDEEEPLQAALDLLAVEGPQAAFYEDGDGVIHFEGRSYRTTETRCTSSQVTFYDRSTGITLGYEEDVAYDSIYPYNGEGGVQHIAPLSYDQGYRNVINAVQIDTVARTVGSLAVVWTHVGTLVLSPLESRTFTAKADDPFKAAVCTNGVDVVVSVGTVTGVTLSRTSGANVNITLVAGAGGATITIFQLRATLVTATATTTVSSVFDASDSIAAYEQQDYRISARKEIDPNVAVDIADAIVQRYQEPLASMQITVLNTDALHLHHQLARQVSDRINVVEAWTGINLDCHINTITHRVMKGGLEHYTLFGVEKVPASVTQNSYRFDDPAAVWDTATFGA